MIDKQDHAHEIATIDRLVTDFYAVFDNRNGRPILVDRLREMFLPEAVIVRIGASALETMTVDNFIAPRARMLTIGSLAEFHEWETSAKTALLRDIACRHSTYA